MESMDPDFKYVGCMVGSALGDAIGEIAFQHPDWERLNEVISEKSLLRYTDDTAMAIAPRGRAAPQQEEDRPTLRRAEVGPGVSHFWKIRPSL